MPPASPSPAFAPENFAAATILAHKIERKRGTVHALFQTDRGPVRLRFTQADARLIGGELRVAAVPPTGERAAEAATPVLKPGGSIL